MPGTRKRSVLGMDQGGRLKPATFRSFDTRPINYYRDVIGDDREDGGDRRGESETRARVEDALQAERERMRMVHEAELQRSYESGVESGRAAAAAEIERAVQLVREYARILQAEKNELAARCERESIDLAFELAKKVLDRELETKPESIRDVVKNVLAQVLDCDQIRLRVNPEDLRHLSQMKVDFGPTGLDATRLDIRGDPTIDRGGAIIETERGLVDARIQSQLDTLKAGLARAE